jgi:1,4-dihydroxy-2-naphthoyl-CoA hydrolase
MSEDFRERLPQREDVHSYLGIHTDAASPERVVLSMEVTQHHQQPFGILHGGVSALLAEGAASIGGVLSVEPGQAVVGTELNISHLRPVRSGVITATATPVRKGRTVQVWAIDIADARGRQIAVARCSMQVISAPSPREA